MVFLQQYASAVVSLLPCWYITMLNTVNHWVLEIVIVVLAVPAAWLPGKTLLLPVLLTLVTYA